MMSKLSFTNAQTSLDSDVLGSTSVEIPDILLEGIGRKSSGVTIREALRQILDPIVRASTEALAKESVNVDELKQQAEDRLDQEVQDRLGTDLDSLKDRFRN